MSYHKFLSKPITRFDDYKGTMCVIYIAVVVSLSLTEIPSEDISDGAVERYERWFKRLESVLQVENSL